MRFSLRDRWVQAILCAVLSVLSWLGAILLGNLFSSLLCVIAVAATLTAVGLTVSALMRHRSPYAVFAVTVAVMAALSSAFGIWHMAHDTSSFFPGLFGLLILLFVLPTAAVLLVLDLLFWIGKNWRAKKAEKKERLAGNFENGDQP